MEEIKSLVYDESEFEKGNNVETNFCWVFDPSKLGHQV